MNFQQIRPRADQLRAIPLPSVLRVLDARPDGHDKGKWHTSRGTLSVNGPKFINWNQGEGGGGAIDLVIHLKNCSFKDALDWLGHHFPQHRANDLAPSASSSALSLPTPDPLQLGHVKDYLTTERAIPLALIQSLIQTGTLYADHRANAVFLLRDPEGSQFGTDHRPLGVPSFCSGTPRGRWSVPNCAEPHPDSGGEWLPVLGRISASSPSPQTDSVRINPRSSCASRPLTPSVLSLFILNTVASPLPAPGPTPPGLGR